MASTGARSARKGKEFERWLVNHYGGIAGGRATRNGYVVEEDGRQSGVDVIIGPYAVQCKKGVTAVPAAVREPIRAAIRHAGRRVPIAVLAPDGDNLGHYVVLRGADFKRIADLLAEHGLEDQLLAGAAFGGG